PGHRNETHTADRPIAVVTADRRWRSGSLRHGRQVGNSMGDIRDMARDPEHRRTFEKLLYLAARRGDADLVAERLSWGIDPNCTFAKGRTPLIANVRSANPSAATVRALLDHGADPSLPDETGLTVLDY